MADAVLADVQNGRTHQRCRSVVCRYIQEHPIGRGSQDDCKGRQAESATGRRTTTRVDLEVAAFLQRGKRQETGCSLLVQYVDGRGHAYVCDFSEMGSMTCDQSLLMPKAAVNYQQNVLNAWQKIDDALSACAAEQHQAQHLQAHVRNVYQLA